MRNRSKFSSPALSLETIIKIAKLCAHRNGRSAEDVEEIERVARSVTGCGCDELITMLPAYSGEPIEDIAQRASGVVQSAAAIEITICRNSPSSATCDRITAQRLLQTIDEGTRRPQD